MKIKKILLLFVFSLALLFVFNAKLQVEASFENNPAFKVNGEEEVEYLLGGVTLHKQKLGALRDLAGNFYYNYDTFHLSTNGNNGDVKIVSWSYRNTEKWQMNGVTEIAKDFEKHNPGWIVVGGTNGDFFAINGNGQMAGNAMENGEMLNSHNDDRNAWFRGIVGFTADGKFVSGIPTLTGYYNMHVYDDSSMKQESKVIKLAAFNPSKISETGITVLTKDNLDRYDLTGYKVAVGKYDLVRKTDENTYYVKGEVLNIRDGQADERPLDIKLNEQTEKYDSIQEFFLISKDGSLDQIKVGDYVKCQQDYTGEYKDVINSTTYYWKILHEGEVMFEGHSNAQKRKELEEKYCNPGDMSYVTCSKARCLFGVKADGSVVMASISGSTSTGMSLSEAAAYMKEIGCVNAWDFDGGGSATIVARNELGQIETINTPSDAGDGTERRVGNAFLMVVRDPGFKVKSKSSTPSSVVLERKTGTGYDEMENIVVEINGVKKTLSATDQLVEFTGLEENTRYDAKVTYTFEGKEYSTSMPVVTKKYAPNINFEPTSKGFYVSVRNTDTTVYVSKVDLTIDDKQYSIQTTDGEIINYEINDLSKNQNYNVSYKYTVIIRENNKTYERIVDGLEYSTLSYMTPSISKFEVNPRRGKVSIVFEIADEDGVVVKAEIVHNGIKEEIEPTANFLTIEDVDIEVMKHTFKLILTYETPEGVEKTVESQEVVLGSEQGGTSDPTPDPDPTPTPTPTPTPEPAKKGCKKKSIVSVVSLISVLALSLVIFRRKK